MTMIDPHWPGIFCIGFLAIVFLQSGIDKLLNYKRELGWVQQKFTRSMLHHYVSVLFLVLTLTESLSGLLCLAGTINLLITGKVDFALYGAWSSCLAMLMLIFGQRMTKDYTGAASLVPYFVVSLLGLHFLYIGF